MKLKLLNSFIPPSRFFFFLGCLAFGGLNALLGAAADYEATAPKACYLNASFDEHGQPSAKLLKLLELVGLPPLNPSEKALPQINQWAQKNLLRQSERWDTQSDQFEALRPSLFPLLQDLGFVEASSAHFNHYQGAIVHGGSLSRMHLRLSYLIQQWKGGVRFKHVYFLAGERPLDEQKENMNALMQALPFLTHEEQITIAHAFPQAETEMLQLLWFRSDVPEEMREYVKAIFINAPMKKDLKSEKLLRPTTDDTVIYWLRLKPVFGRYLAITSAPFAPRQDLVIRTLSPKEYTFDTIGPKANDHETMAVFLDELARYIYQTYKKINQR